LPIGNGDVTALVNFNGATNTLQLLIEKQDAWNEGALPFKSALIDFTSPSLAAFTSMSLDMATATVTLSFADTDSIKVYVDASTNVIVVTASLPLPLTYKINSLRTKATTDVPPLQCDNSTISADFYLGEDTFGHRNENEADGSNYFSKTLAQFNLESAIPELESFDPLVNRTTGGKVIQQDEKTFLVALLTELRVDSVASFSSSLDEFVETITIDKTAHDEKWAAFNGLSHIAITSTTDADVAGTVTRQYAINRYLQRLQSSTENPIKFNGMAFTALRENLDMRDWGGHNWWQNVRLQYYSMLNAGDFEGLKTSLFRTYLNYLPYSATKTKLWFPDMTDAIVIDEYQSIFGSSHAGSYGCIGTRDEGLPDSYSKDIWNGYNYQGMLDLSAMMLEYYSFTGDKEFLSECMELIGGEVNFFAQRWTRRDAQGKVIMFPTQSVETFQVSERSERALMKTRMRATTKLN